MVGAREILVRQLPHFWYSGDVSVEQLESAFLRLNADERQRLALWFEENRRELLGDEGDELSEEQENEVLRRRDLAAAQPELLEPWKGTIERLREHLHDFSVRAGLALKLPLAEQEALDAAALV